MSRHDSVVAGEIRHCSGPSRPTATGPSSWRSAACCAPTPSATGEILDGFGADEISPGVGRPDPRARGPTGSATGSTRSRGQAYQLRAHRAGPAQRDPRAGQLVPVEAGRAGAGRRDAGVRPAAAGRLPVVADAAHPVERLAPTACAADQEVANTSDQNAPWGFSVHPYLQLAGRAGRRHPAAGAGPDPGAGRRPAAADRRRQGRRHRVRLHRAAPRSVDAVLDTTFGDLEPDADGGSSVDHRRRPTGDAR